MSDPGTRSILVSGWRFLTHSYSVVARALCLEILRRGPGYRLWFEDVPYYNSSWRPAAGLCSPAQEAALNAIPPPPPGARAAAELRFGFPYDLLRPPRAPNCLVFATAELLCVPRVNVPEGLGVDEAQRRHGLEILTCSQWSKEGFVASGVAPENVLVVPLGFDPEVFAPVGDDERARIRSEMKIGPDEFVFLNAGAMTPNKGIGILLRAFAQVLERRPQARLLLKGSDALYPSGRFADQSLQALDQATAEKVLSRLHYVGEELSTAGMARLYHAADCYASSYLAEGFNLPVLEAAACGLPVICTEGGSTDDFVTDDFALRIASTRVSLRVEGAPGAQGLLPDLDHLVHHMLCVIDDADLRATARRAGPAHVGERFTWARFADRLLPVLFPAAAGRAGR